MSGNVFEEGGDALQGEIAEIAEQGGGFPSGLFRSSGAADLWAELIEAGGVLGGTYPLTFE